MRELLSLVKNKKGERMSFITKCYHCNKRIYIADEQFKCPKCDAICCSLRCWLKHKCSTLPRLIEPWEEDQDDVMSMIRFMAKLYWHGAVDENKKSAKARCFECKKETDLLGDDVEWSLCRSCFEKLRQEALDELDYDPDIADAITFNYRIMRIPDEKLRKTSVMNTMPFVIANIAAEDCVSIPVTIETRKGKTETKMELFDLKFWNIEEITILHIGDKIFEFTPGTYLIIKDE